MNSQEQLVVLGDRYEISTPLGSGSAANVFRVRDRRNGAMRAAKILKPENAEDPGILARFEDEFRILRTLHHPHLPEVYDYGWTDDGGRFLIMELVDGVPLDEFFRSNPGDIWAILYELCEALTFVHSHKLLHQDIKPSNILVRRTTAFGPDLPLVKLIDFGLTYRRDVGAMVELVGTPEYMSPEVVRGETPLTRAVDYYSLGVTLYELLCGRPPFVGPESQVMRAHLQREPVIQEEQLEWAELYPHVRALLTKDWRKRLEAFEELRRAVTSRLTGGIEALDRAYGLARIDSLPMIGKEEVWGEIEKWLTEVENHLSRDARHAPALDIRGRRGRGRKHVVDDLCAEGEIRGFHVARFGGGINLLQAEGQGLRQVDRFDRAIAGFTGRRSSAVLLVIDGIERLSDDEASFIRYLSTKRELAADGATRILFVTVREVDIDGSQISSHLPSNSLMIQLPPDAIVSVNQSSDEDARVQLLGSSVFTGERSIARRRLLAYIASHPAAVPSNWAREFSGPEFADDLEQLVIRHLVSKVVLDGTDALASSDDARAIVQDLVSLDARKQIHRDFISRLKHEIEAAGSGQSSVYELIAHHEQSLGEARAAVIARILGVRAAWRDGSLSSVERLSQVSLEALVEPDNGYTSTARRHFVRQWVRALWSRNQHTKARQVIDDHIFRLGETIPHTLLPKYIRGILDAQGPAPALKFVDGIDVEQLSARTTQRILVEKALLLCQSARYQESLDLLQRVNGKLLDQRDRYRATIYKAMNLFGMGAHDQIEDLLNDASRRARADNYNDEFALMSAIRAQVCTIQGRPRDSLRIIAQTLQIAHRHELYFRLNVLYRLAASAYQDLGQPRKATLSQQRAITLASALGLTQFEAVSWSRLAEYERIRGNFGNAVRYLNKAGAVIASSSYEADRARLNVAKLQIHLWLQSPELQKVIDEASWIEGTSAVNERGRYLLMMGNHFADCGEWQAAGRCYALAANPVRHGGHVDNLIAFGRARLRLTLLAGPKRRIPVERRILDSRELRMADSSSGQLERNLALLEYAFHRRLNCASVSGLCEVCLQLCDESTEAMIRLEALSLVFRAYARNNRRTEARSVFEQFYALVRIATSNLEETYIPGLMDRLGLAQLMQEFDSMERNNKAGVATGLVA